MGVTVLTICILCAFLNCRKYKISTHEKIYHNPVFYGSIYPDKHTYIDMDSPTEDKCELCENIRDDPIILDCCKSTVCFPCSTKLKISNNGCPLCYNPFLKI